VEAGLGNDDIIIDGNIQGGIISLVVRGGGGNDKVEINAPTGASRFLVDDGVDGGAVFETTNPGFPLLEYNDYGETSSLQINGNAQTTVVVEDTAKTSPSITTNAVGTVVVDPQYVAGEQVLSPVTINDATSVSIGGGRADLVTGGVTIHSPDVQTALTLDLSAAGNEDVDVQPGTVFIIGVQPVTFDAGRLSSLTLDGGASKQNFILGSNSPLDQIPNNITVVGQGTSDNLIVDGSASADDYYTVRNSQITASHTFVAHFVTHHSVTNQISYSGLASVRVIGEENSGNGFLVQSTAAATTTALEGGSGTNDFTIGDPKDSIDKDLGPILVNGGSAADVVTLDDTGTQLTAGNIVAPSVGFTVTGGLTVFGQPIGTINRQASYVVTQGRFFQRKTYTATIDYKNVGRIRILGSPLDTSFLVQSTAPGTPVALTAGTGSNAFQVGDANNPLDLLQASVYLAGNGSASTLFLNDTTGVASQNYLIYTDHFNRTGNPSEAPSCAPVYYADLTGITLDTGQGVEATGGTGNNVFVTGSAANVPVTVNGHAGVEEEYIANTYGPSGPTPLLAPVAFHGADYYTFGEYYDYATTTSQTYTLSADPTVATRQLVRQTGDSMVSFDGVSEVILYSSKGGGSAVNVRGVAQGVTLNMGLVNGDVVTVGSQAPNLGGNLATINGNILLNDGGGSNHATLIIDDSGDPQGRNATITGPAPNDPTNPYTSLSGLAPNSATINWVLGNGSPVTILGGSGGNSFVIHGSIPNVALTIKGGSGNNLLIAGLTAADLIGGPGNNILIGGTTDFDYNAAAINAIMAELAQATAATFGSVVNALRTGANGLPALNASSVHSNGLANQLTGGGGLDSFFASSMDQALDFTDRDVFTTIQ
jgi:hypothetical protein